MKAYWKLIKIVLPKIRKTLFLYIIGTGIGSWLTSQASIQTGQFIQGLSKQPVQILLSIIIVATVFIFSSTGTRMLTGILYWKGIYKETQNTLNKKYQDKFLELAPLQIINQETDKFIREFTLAETAVREFYANSIDLLIPNMLNVAASILSIFLTGWKEGCIFFTFSCVYGCVYGLRIIKRYAIEESLEKQEKEAANSFRNFIKSFNSSMKRNQKQAAKVYTMRERFTNSYLRHRISEYEIKGELNNLIFSFCTVTLMLFSVLYYSKNIGGSLVLAVAIIMSIRGIVFRLIVIEQGRTKVEQIIYFLEYRPLFSAQELTKVDKPKQGLLQVTNVSADIPPSYDLLTKGKITDGKPNAICNVSFEIGIGEILGIIGTNGAGKSTLLKVLTRELPPNSGEISLASTNILTTDYNIIDITSDQPFIKGTLRENILLNANCKVDDDELYELLEQLSLPYEEIQQKGGLDCLVSEDGKPFSMGQRRKVTIARCLLSAPDIILADEVTTYLDFFSRKKVMQTIKMFAQKTGIVLIFATQNLDELLYADKVLVLDKGQVASFGPLSGLDGDTVFKEVLPTIP